MNSNTMKTVLTNMHLFLTNLTFSKEKMPALIPIRVITKVNPNSYR